MTRLARPLTLSACALAASVFLAACGGGSAGTPPDQVAPRVMISSSAAADTTVTGPVTFTFNFSEDARSSFTLDDVSVTGGTPGALTWVSDRQATLVVTPTPNSFGQIKVSVAAASFTDAAGNANVVYPSYAQNYNTVIPGAGGSTGTCTAAPCIDFSDAGVGYTGFGGASGSQVSDPLDPANQVARLVKSAGAEVWGGVTIVTLPASGAVAPAGLGSNKIVTLRVLSPAAGVKIKLKFEDVADPTHSVETDALTTVANAWETLTFDLGTPSAGTAPFNAAYTYNKVSVFPDFGNTPGADENFYVDELKYAAATGGGGGGGGSGGASGSTGTCTTAPCLDFSASSVAYTGFGGASGSQDVDPADPANKVARLVKTAGAQVWAGVTVATTAANNSVAAAALSSNRVVTLRFYSPAAGKSVKLKFEDAADGSHSVETDATTTVANAWETLSFDFTNLSAGTPALNAGYTYDKVSIFPDFGNTPGTDEVFYADELKYTGVSGGGGSSGTLDFGTGYTAAGATAQGGTWGYFSGDFSSYANTYTGGGFADSSPPVSDASQYFYLAVTTTAPTAPVGGGAPTSGGYLGMYVTYPGAGVSVAGKSNLLINLGMDANFFQQTSNKDITLLIVGATVYSNGSGGNCQVTLRRDLTPTSDAMLTYTVALSSFTLIQSCNGGGFSSGVNSVADALQQPIGAVNSQFNYPNVNTTINSGTAGAPIYATGLTRGKTSFQ